MLQAYEGYVDNGYIVLLGNPHIPEGSRLIITVLDDPIPNEWRSLHSRRIPIGDVVDIDNAASAVKQEGEES